jgi:hypothetical protein
MHEDKVNKTRTSWSEIAVQTQGGRVLGLISISTTVSYTAFSKEDGSVTL